MRFIFLLGRIISRVYNFRMSSFLNYLRDIFYSGWIKGAFGRVGSNFQIEYPLHGRGLKQITIGDNFRSYKRLRIETYNSHLGAVFAPRLVIGDNVSLNYDCHIACINNVTVGSNVLIASRVFITDHAHGTSAGEELVRPPGERLLYSKGPVIIEDNVWIGANSVVTAGVTIGKHAIIGAGSVITKDIPPYSVAVGNPARVIKKYNFETGIWQKV